MKKKIKNNDLSLTELENELQLTEAAIDKTTEELNARRRTISELKTRKTMLEDQIKAKKLELLENAVANQYGMSMDKFMDAVKSGDILVDEKVVKTNKHEGVSDNNNEENNISTVSEEIPIKKD